MVVHSKLRVDSDRLIRDPRSWTEKLADNMSDRFVVSAMLAFTALGINLSQKYVGQFADILLIVGFIHAWIILKAHVKFPLKAPQFYKGPDSNNMGPGRSGKPEGILFLGNIKEDGREMWLTNSDARTHILYLGTTGSGKTVGLQALAANSLCWGSGFIYVDGKADTDLWANLYSLCRRFGREDDLLLLNYMTGNSDEGSASNTLNPFIIGSGSYLSNLVVSMMPESGGDNAMWKDRAVSLMGALMPALTYKRDHANTRLDVSVIRDHLSLNAIVRVSRDKTIPLRITRAVTGYLETLPGFNANAYDDEGRERAPGPGEPPFDMTTSNQQHGFLSMQFTRALQSLADEYGYIFNTELADVDMSDVVLNRRILVVLIPALEKSPDEAANLGKIVAASIKGMMGGTLGSSVEGESARIIDTKPTRSASPFMTIFDEVGYYTAPGMAMMAAQARSLGFCLVFASQDLPAMEKRVKEEAKSITANCNLKIFGKLEDPTTTKEFFDSTVSTYEALVAESYTRNGSGSGSGFNDGNQASIKAKEVAGYEDLKGQKEGEAHVIFGDKTYAANMFYAPPKRVKAIRVQKLLKLTTDREQVPVRNTAVDRLAALMKRPNWNAGQEVGRGNKQLPPSEEIRQLIGGFQLARKAKMDDLFGGAIAVANIARTIPVEEEVEVIDNEQGRLGAPTDDDDMFDDEFGIGRTPSAKGRSFRNSNDDMDEMPRRTAPDSENAAVPKNALDFLSATKTAPELKEVVAEDGEPEAEKPFKAVWKESADTASNTESGDAPPDPAEAQQRYLDMREKIRQKMLSSKGGASDAVVGSTAADESDFGVPASEVIPTKTAGKADAGIQTDTETGAVGYDIESDTDPLFSEKTDG